MRGEDGHEAVSILGAHVPSLPSAAALPVVVLGAVVGDHARHGALAGPVLPHVVPALRGQDEELQGHHCCVATHDCQDDTCAPGSALTIGRGRHRGLPRVGALDPIQDAQEAAVRQGTGWAVSEGEPEVEDVAADHADPHEQRHEHDRKGHEGPSEERAHDAIHVALVRQPWREGQVGQEPMVAPEDQHCSCADDTSADV
mmetsp:Transcript_9762/g.27552  ORF Transcript_9762/g.27552 Transcript_9762/m.27552 type:complete len:200 (+) Transcript_9762:2168-2767(+)